VPIQQSPSLLVAASRSAAAIATLSMLASPVLARTSGIAGYSGENGGLFCSNAGLGCHEANAGAQQPTVRFEGPNQVDPGAEITYRFVLTSQNPTVQIQAGLDVAASGGQLVVVAGQQTRMLQGEITHTGPKDLDANHEAAWEFIWRAPAAPGVYVLFGAGNNVNASATVEGDEANLTMLMVTVGSVLPTATPTATPIPAACAGDCNGDGTVAVNELVLGVTMALGTGSIGSCPALDMNGDHTIAVNELVSAVTKALNGC
jgi:hypothetical protein